MSHDDAAKQTSNDLAECPELDTQRPELDDGKSVDDLFRDYTTALFWAQTTHKALDWINAGKRFEMYVVASVAADRRTGAAG